MDAGSSQTDETGDASKCPEPTPVTPLVRQLHEDAIDPDVAAEILKEIQKAETNIGDKAVVAQVQANIEKIVEKNAKTIIPPCAGFGEQPGLTFENWNPMKDAYYSALNFAPNPDDDEPEIATLLGARHGGEAPCRFNDGISGSCWKGSRCKYSHPIGNVEVPIAQPPVILAKSLPKKLGSATGAFIKVKVYYIIDPLDFYVVPTEQFKCLCGGESSPSAKNSSGVVALRTLMTGLAKFMNLKFRGYQTDIYETNQLVACRLPVGSVRISGFSGFSTRERVEPEWHRGVVLKQTKADLTAEVAVVEVQLIDVGLKLSIPFVDCASLPKQFTTRPALAYHCCLFGIIPLGNKFNGEATRYFKELVEGKDVLLMVRTTNFPNNLDNSSCFEDPPYHVDLRILPDRYSASSKGSAAKKPNEESSSSSKVDLTKSDNEAGHDNPPAGTEKKIKYPSESAIKKTGVDVVDEKLDAAGPPQPCQAIAIANARAKSKETPSGSGMCSDPKEEFDENSAEVLAAKAKVAAEHAKYEKEKLDLTSEKDISTKGDAANKKSVSRGPGDISSSRDVANVSELVTHKIAQANSGVQANDKDTNTKKPSRFKPRNVVELLAEKGYGLQENPFPNLPAGMPTTREFLRAAFLLQPTCSCNMPTVSK